MEVFGATKPQRRFRPPRGRKVFTLDQANRSLLLVSRIVADLVKQHRRVCRLEEKCQIMRSGESEERQQAVRDECTLELEKLRELRDELAAIGCQLKDWRRGIVDFLIMHDGRPVELCWRFGEQRIEHWHEIDAGFRGRQPIDERFHRERASAESRP